MRIGIYRRFTFGLASLLLSFGAGAVAHADEALIAVAANFADSAERLAPAFERKTGHRVVITTGATGKLYTQIKAGAPFQVLLSADAEIPARLESENAAVSGTRFTYAVGRLALWSSNPDQIPADGAEALEKGDFRHLAIANPALAPYGVAAQQTLDALGLTQTLSPKLVMGENIGQTFSMVATGNAELGFVALSAVQSPAKSADGSLWVVPQHMYHPIKQDAVLLTAGKDNAAARAFLDFLKSTEAHTIIESYGYGLD
jgi:molybdate transport system substrate-binding protein